MKQTDEPIYKITEWFTSIQGEGIETGRPVLFVRFAGCNLNCDFCDTDYKANWKMDLKDLLHLIHSGNYFEILNIKHVILTGGEPLMQNIKPLVIRLKSAGYTIGLETNGMFELPYTFDSVSVSPKVPAEQLKVKKCNSLKLLYPYLRGCSPSDYMTYDAEYKYIQPIENSKWSMNIEGAYMEVLRLGEGWRLGLQIHKTLEVR